MMYSYEQVSRLVLSLADHLKKPIHLGRAHQSWASAVDEIAAAQKVIVVSDLHFLNYVRALARAKHFLENDKNALSDINLNTKHAELDKHIAWSIKICNVMIAKESAKVNHNPVTHAPKTHTHPAAVKATEASVASSPGIGHQITSFLSNAKSIVLDGAQKIAASADRSEAVTYFINSEAFQRLLKYNNTVLYNDIRDHSFLGINLRVDKYQVLKKFTDRLQYAITMREVNLIFEDFYNGGKEFANAYQKLSTGQNITTRFFSQFGLRTTTVTLIDELNELRYSMSANQFRI